MIRSLWLQDEPCRYCFELDDEVYVTPCSCSGSLGRVHLSCLKKGGVQICPTCNTRFTIDLGMPDRASAQCWLDSFRFSPQDSSNTLYTLYQEYSLVVACEDYTITRREVPPITETDILHTNVITERSSRCDNVVKRQYDKREAPRRGRQQQHKKQPKRRPR